MMRAGRRIEVQVEPWTLKAPFVIAGHTFTTVELLTVSISEGDNRGRGEATGVYYLDETGQSMLDDVERFRATVESGIDRDELRELMPAGGARNAIDCALWDLEAKQKGTSVWDLTGIVPREVTSVMTVGIDTPERMAEAARQLDTDRIKVKLDGEKPLARISAIRNARPDAEIIVDVNQGWTFDQLVGLAPDFEKAGIAMIEQPLPRGGDAELEYYNPPLPLCADESCLGVAEFDQAARRYQMINIKLDKTGGLTEALELVKLARGRGIGLMVGNMVGTSLGMAPGFVVAQHCRFVDLDGALFLEHDCEYGMAWKHGVLSVPTPDLWG